MFMDVCFPEDCSKTACKMMTAKSIKCLNYIWYSKIKCPTYFVLKIFKELIISMEGWKFTSILCQLIKDICCPSEQGRQRKNEVKTMTKKNKAHFLRWMSAIHLAASILAASEYGMIFMWSMFVGDHVFMSYSCDQSCSTNSIEVEKMIRRLWVSYPSLLSQTNAFRI